MAKVEKTNGKANSYREIRWTDEAVSWLHEIHSYIAEDNQNIANKVINEIYEKVQVLVDFPKIGYKYENRENIRILLYGHYRIAYLIKKSGDIDILGVFHGALDIERYLKI